MAKSLPLLILLTLIASLTPLCWHVLGDLIASLLFAGVMSLTAAPFLRHHEPSRSRLS